MPRPVEQQGIVALAAQEEKFNKAAIDFSKIADDMHANPVFAGFTDNVHAEKKSPKELRVQLKDAFADLQAGVGQLGASDQEWKDSKAFEAIKTMAKWTSEFERVDLGPRSSDEEKALAQAAEGTSASARVEKYLKDHPAEKEVQFFAWVAAQRAYDPKPFILRNFAKQLDKESKGVAYGLEAEQKFDDLFDLVTGQPTVAGADEAKPYVEAAEAELAKPEYKDAFESLNKRSTEANKLFFNNMMAQTQAVFNSREAVYADLLRLLSRLEHDKLEAMRTKLSMPPAASVGLGAAPDGLMALARKLTVTGKEDVKNWFSWDGAHIDMANVITLTGAGQNALDSVIGQITLSDVRRLSQGEKPQTYTLYPKNDADYATFLTAMIVTKRSAFKVDRNCEARYLQNLSPKTRVLKNAADQFCALKKANPGMSAGEIYKKVADALGSESSTGTHDKKVFLTALSEADPGALAEYLGASFDASRSASKKPIEDAEEKIRVARGVIETKQAELFGPPVQDPAVINQAITTERDKITAADREIKAEEAKFTGGNNPYHAFLKDWVEPRGLLGTSSPNPNPSRGDYSVIAKTTPHLSSENTLLAFKSLKAKIGAWQSHSFFKFGREPGSEVRMRAFCENLSTAQLGGGGGSQLTDFAEALAKEDAKGQLAGANADSVGLALRYLKTDNNRKIFLESYSEALVENLAQSYRDDPKKMKDLFPAAGQAQSQLSMLFPVEYNALKNALKNDYENLFGADSEPNPGHDPQNPALIPPQTKATAIEAFSKKITGVQDNVTTHLTTAVTIAAKPTTDTGRIYTCKERKETGRKLIREVVLPRCVDAWKEVGMLQAPAETQAGSSVKRSIDQACGAAGHWRENSAETKAEMKTAYIR